MNSHKINIVKILYIFVLLCACYLGYIFYQQYSKKVLVGKGSVYYREGKYNNAIQSWQNAVNNEPEDASLFLSIGNAYFKQGKWVQAKFAYQKAIHLSRNRSGIIASQAQKGIDLAWVNINAETSLRSENKSRAD